MLGGKTLLKAFYLKGHNLVSLRIPPLHNMSCQYNPILNVLKISLYLSGETIHFSDDEQSVSFHNGIKSSQVCWELLLAGDEKVSRCELLLQKQLDT